jgi:hypothetical protein
VDEVATGNLRRAPQRLAQTKSLDHDHGHDETDVREPHDGRKDTENSEQHEEDDRWRKYEHSRSSGARERRCRHRGLGDDGRRPSEGETDERGTDDQCEGKLRDTRQLRQAKTRSSGKNSERDHRPEPLRIEADRLGHELSDRPRLGRQRSRRRPLLPAHRRHATAILLERLRLKPNSSPSNEAASGSPFRVTSRNP